MKINKLFFAFLVLFAPSMFYSIYASPATAVSECDKSLTAAKVSSLMDIYKKDPRGKKDPKAFQKELDKAQSALNSGIGKPSKDFWASKPNMDATFINIGKQQTGCK